MSRLSAIPVNIITGFLGVGKTTAIRSLLANKPEAERWAVLVNEFGEVGIDGVMLGAAQNADEGIFVREVPGGCMCCVMGLPTQVAINQLVMQAKPDRLLIEPTGLGHPREVINMLTSGSFADLFALQATLTLVDARKLKDPQYTEHAIFIDQLKVADVIVASKADCYQPDDLSLLHEFLQDQGLADRPCFAVENGAVQAHWLNARASAVQAQAVEHQHQHDHDKTTNQSASQTADIFAETVRFPDSGFVRKDYLNDNSAINAQAFHSSGWIFSPTICFDYKKLYGMLLGLDVERMKAVFITDEGIFAFNFVDQVLSTIELDEVMDSRIEVIGTDPQQWIDLEAGLLAAKSEAF